MECKCKTEMEVLSKTYTKFSKTLKFGEYIYWCNECGRVFIDSEMNGELWLEPENVTHNRENYFKKNKTN